MILPLAAIDTSSNTLRTVFSLTVPEIVLLAIACAIYLGGTVVANRRLWATAALAGLAAGAFFWTRDIPKNFDPSVAPLLPDALADVVRLIAYGGGALLFLLCWDDVADAHAAEFFATLLILVAGVSLVGAANDLITLFLALELISIPTYLLLYLPRAGAAAQEAAIKYFYLSILSSALLLFGLSYMYGVGGTTNLTEFFRRQAGESSPLAGLSQVALLMIVAGLGFRITAAPFHFYAPDVFQGAPTSIAAMLAFVPKVAGFTALVRVLGMMSGTGVGLAGDGQTALLFWLLAAVTMTVGNVLALLQNDLKRILAYSSIAHGGYMLIGLAAAPYLRGGPRELHGTESVFFYLIAYGAMTIGAFAVIFAARNSRREVQTVDDLAGFGRVQPLVALAFTVFLFSLIGLPLTAGFSGKFMLFMSAIRADEHLGESRGLFLALALIGVLNSAIGAFYYLRIVATMYLRDAIKPEQPVVRVPALATVAVCFILTVILGIYPTPLIQRLHEATTIAPTAPPRTAAMR